MATFAYTAIDGTGNQSRGQLTADSEDAAATTLKQQGMFPVSIVRGAVSRAPAGASAAAKRTGNGGNWLNRRLFVGRLKRRELMTITRQLATLLDAGLPLVRSLRTLAQQLRDPAKRRIFTELVELVEGGRSLSEALGFFPTSFNRLYINMVRAGEASGAMEEVLNRLASHLEKQQRLRSRIKSALTYPIVVLVIALAITCGLMIFIVPKFATIFSEMLAGEPLPALTDFVLGLSQLLLQHSASLAGAVVTALVLLHIGRRTRVGGYVFDLLSLKSPPFGGLVTKSGVAQFSQTLGTLLSSGVSILNALQIARDTAGNRLIAAAVQTMHDAVKEGIGLAPPMTASQVFPSMAVSMIEVGEETGALPEMLHRVASTYEAEVDHTVEALTSLIEPVMIVFLAVVVGTIVIALFLPLIRVIEMG